MAEQFCCYMCTIEDSLSIMQRLFVSGGDITIIYLILCVIQELVIIAFRIKFR